jgi:ubiquinone/menaquinone biosynthesis C-methylase UbiE
LAEESIVSSVSAPDPGLLWDTINAHQRTAALRAAIELDIFTAVGEGARTAEALAAERGASVRGVRILCDYLTVVGFFLKDAGGYSLTPMSAAFLDRRSPACMASVVKFLNSPKLLSAFRDLTEVVRGGTTLLPQGGVTEAELDEWVIFARSMMPIVSGAAEFIGEIATRDGVKPRRVLDIAAGHGLFGIAVARRAPEAEIVAADWPNVLTVARENARAAGVDDRYHLLEGDAFHVAFGEGYDLALLTNFLHHFNEADCEALLYKIYACLRPGGRVLTLEFVPDENRVTPPIPAQFSMMMLGLTPEGDAYTFEQLDRMLRRAGFARNELRQVPQSPQQLIVSEK